MPSRATREFSRSVFLRGLPAGKTPASPTMILEYAARNHYSADEVRALAFAGTTPDAAALSRRWHAMLAAGKEIIEALPAAQSGNAVLAPDGSLFTGVRAELADALRNGLIRFHAGSIRGALPRIIDGALAP